MYNQYLAAAGQAQPIHTPVRPDSPPTPDSSGQAAQAGQAVSALSGLTRSLSGRLQNFRLDMDAVIVLIIVWFLLSDGGELDWEQLFLIGALLLLGV